MFFVEAGTTAGKAFVESLNSCKEIVIGLLQPVFVYFYLTFLELSCDVIGILWGILELDVIFVLENG